MARHPPRYRRRVTSAGTQRRRGAERTVAEARMVCQDLRHSHPGVIFRSGRGDTHSSASSPAARPPRPACSPRASHRIQACVRAQPVQRHRQASGHLAVAEIAREQPEHRQLSVGQRLTAVRWRAPSSRGTELTLERVDSAPGMNVPVRAPARGRSPERRGPPRCRPGRRARPSRTSEGKRARGNGLYLSPSAFGWTTAGTLAGR